MAAGAPSPIVHCVRPVDRHTAGSPWSSTAAAKPLASTSNALANAHLYSVMFGDRTLAGFELSEEDRQYGRFNLIPVVNTAARCVESGRFRDEDAMLVAHHMWLAMHGGVTLELGGYLIDPCDADRCFETKTVTLMVGAGDSLEAARASVRDSAERFARTFGDSPADSSAEGVAKGV